ncbi:putative Beta-N-acetylhexosaminidase [[Clostridium] ultunense Esp]|nr:putative Beta-N-acetylhexosaminidase [[Clostridium] ultunense Esp]
MDTERLINPSFSQREEHLETAMGWEKNPENVDFVYRMIKAVDSSGTIRLIQSITGKGRGSGYVWQRRPAMEGEEFLIEGRVKTVGETTAQIWCFFLDNRGKSIIREESCSVLGNSDWTTIRMNTKAPAGTQEIMIFAIHFTVWEEASSLWDFVSVKKRDGVWEQEDSEIKISGQRETSPVIIPRPQHMNRLQGIPPFQLKKDLPLKVICDNVERYKQLLVMVKKISKTHGISFHLDHRDEEEGSGLTVFCDETLPIPQEGYSLWIGKDRIYLKGKTIIGIYYGLQTLLQLIEQASNGLIPAYEVNDWPDFAWRAVHIPMDFASPSFMLELIEKVWGRYKLNRLIIESSMIRWDSHPEIWKEEASSKKELERVIHFAREHYLQVYPLIQSLGHCKWLFFNGANMDICEDPETPWCYNPLNPRSYRVIFDIFEEAIDLFQKPEFFHIGHDEVRIVGRFPNSEKGKKIGFENLFVMDVNYLSDYLRKKGIRAMMWADVIQESSFNEGLVRHLDPDVLMVDWQYQLPSIPRDQTIDETRF